MSRGHGTLQRQILQLLQQHPEGAPPLVPSRPLQEWTTEALYTAIYWPHLNDPHHQSGINPYSLKASIRRALETLRAEGLITRTPSKATCRGRGRVPWVWSLAPASASGASAAARLALAANRAKRAQFKARIDGGRRLW